MESASSSRHTASTPEPPTATSSASMCSTSASTAPRRRRQDGAHDHVPRVPARRARPLIVLDAEKAEYYRAIRTFEDDGGERFVRFAEHMAELNLEEFSSLVPQNLLLPPLEECIKHPGFDESDLSFFE